MVNNIHGDLNVLNHIIQVLEGSPSSGMIGMQLDIKKEESITELENLKATIKTSCKKLLNLLTAEELEKLNISTVMQLFAEDKKIEILNLVKK